MISPNISPEYLNEKRREIGQRIKDIRYEKGLSKLQVAEMAGLTEKLVSKIEHGNYNYPIDYLSLIAVALDLEITLLLKG